MAAVTQIIPNYLGGVSNQPDVKKLNGQVRTAENTFPDPTFGLTKRPGFEYKKTLGTTPEFEDGKWFHIHRSDEESYFGVIVENNMRLWNAMSGVEAEIDFTNQTIELTEDGTKGLDQDKENLPTTTDGQGVGMTVNLIHGDGVCVKMTVNQEGSGYVQGDIIRVTSADAGTVAPVVGVIYTSDSRLYLNGTRDDFDILTVQDTSIVTNKTIQVLPRGEIPFTLGKKSTVRVMSVEYSSNYTIRINDEEVTYLTRNADVFEQAGTNLALNADEILNTLKSAVDGMDNLPAGFHSEVLMNTLEMTADEAFYTDAKGGKVNESLVEYQDQVENIAKLSETTYNGRKCKVINSAGEGDDYWVEFIADNGISGIGFWEETLDPTVSDGLNELTMPYELVNFDVNQFKLRPIDWEKRLVGDDSTNSHPSFVNNTIQQCFFYSNRLGILTEDNVSMSQAGEYFNFYHTSALTQIASDPVDLSCSSIKPAVLHGVVPTTQGLVLFSKLQQFLMFSDSGVFTPVNTVIKTISNYEMDTDIDPVDSGRDIVFLSKTPSYTRIFSMQTRGQNENPVTLDIGKVVAEWIPNTVDQLISSSQNSLIALCGSHEREVYFFRRYFDGEKDLMQSWFNWKLPGIVKFMDVTNDRFVAITEQSGQYTFSLANLNLVPDADIIVNTDGVSGNPCMDMYAAPSSVTYDTVTHQSKCYLPYNDITELTPVILITGEGVVDTQSGYSLTPARGTDATGDYFLVEREDLASIVDHVIVGYRYNYDVTLPATYFKLDPSGTLSDYTASLTIARMKFSLGLSGVCGFKVNSRGNPEWLDIKPVQEADYYRADDVPLVEEIQMTIPIHQKNTNFQIKVYSDSPFPVSLNSLMWEGNYSPRYYKRAS